MVTTTERVTANTAAAFLAALLLLPVAPQASEAWLVGNIASWHSERYLSDGSHANQVNPGLGGELRFDSLSLMAGAYRNSYERASVYALAGWQPLTYGYLRAGLFAGAATGYREECDASVCAVGGVLLSLQGERFGANLLAIPKRAGKNGTVVGFQLKWRAL